MQNANGWAYLKLSWAGRDTKIFANDVIPHVRGRDIFYGVIHLRALIRFRGSKSALLSDASFYTWALKKKWKSVPFVPVE